MSHPLAPETRNDILLRGMGGSLGQGVWHKTLKRPVGPETRNDLVIGLHASGLVSTEKVYKITTSENLSFNHNQQNQVT